MPGMPQSVNSKINLPQAYKLYYEKGYTYQDIGNHFGVSKQAVCKRFKAFSKYLPDPEAVQTYRDNRVSVLDAVESTYISDLVDPVRREKASLNNTAYAFQQIHNARRIESGLSSVNVSIIARLDGLEKSVDQAGSVLDQLDHEIAARTQDVGPSDTEVNSETS